MPDASKLSRRERQIMNIVFEHESVTVQEIRKLLPNPPTPMAVRRMLTILVEKGFLKREKKGRQNVFSARQRKGSAGFRALKEVLETFFDGSIGQALATHLRRPGSKISAEEVKRLNELIKELNQEHSSSSKKESKR